MINNKTMLVTGGAGFIGSNLVEYLLNKKINIICLDNFDNFYPRKVKESNINSSIKSKLYTLIEGDIRDKQLLESIFKKNEISLVIHLAAKAGVRPSLLNPNEYLDVNISGTNTLLEAMKNNDVKKMIFSSSSSIYGNNKKTPYSENDNSDFPISPYAASKKAGELLTHTYYHLYNIDVINLRFFTVYGPRQRPDLAIHKFFKDIYQGQPADLYGDGSTSRDYTFIEDILQGIYGAIDYLTKNQNIYEIINLGNNNAIKLIDLINEIENVTHKKLIFNRLAKQPGDVNHTYADIEKAKLLLSYNPLTSLKDGLIKFKNWYEESNS